MGREEGGGGSNMNEVEGREGEVKLGIGEDGGERNEKNLKKIV